MFKRIIKFSLLLILICIIAVSFNNDFRQNIKNRLSKIGFFSDLKTFNVSLKKLETTVQDISNNLPKPLVAKDINGEGYLVPKEIIKFTNDERIKEGLIPFSENLLLKRAAEIKVQDMFTNNYFEHNSPQGKSPSDFINEVGYEYITVGENLAMGIFKDEKDLVTAWMNSPGHRANILGKFAEIGVSAKKGLYNGEEVWMSVQEFGSALSLCNKPSETEKKEIEAHSISIKELLKNLNILLNTLKQNEQNTSLYRQNVESYNEMVKKYNSLVRDLGVRSDLYNKKAKEFNDCVLKYTK